MERLHNLVLFTLIAAFLPWSLLILLIFYGYDETRRILFAMVEAAFGVAATVAVVLKYLIIEFLIILGVLVLGVIAIGISILLR